MRISPLKNSKKAMIKMAYQWTNFSVSIRKIFVFLLSQKSFSFPIDLSFSLQALFIFFGLTLNIIQKIFHSSSSVQCWTNCYSLKVKRETREVRFIAEFSWKWTNIDFTWKWKSINFIRLDLKKTSPLGCTISNCTIIAENNRLCHSGTPLKKSSMFHFPKVVN